MPGLLPARAGAEVGDGFGQVIPALVRQTRHGAVALKLIEMTARAADGPVRALARTETSFGARGWPRSGHCLFEKYPASASISSRSIDATISCMMSLLRSPRLKSRSWM